DAGRRDRRRIGGHHAARRNTMTLVHGSLMRRVVALAVIAASAHAQGAPAVRPISAPGSISPPQPRAGAAAPQLPDGRVLVNDTQRRQLLLFDASLTTINIIADSGTGTARSYGARAGGIVPYLADSTLFVDPAGLSMLVIDPSGAVARVASLPRS